MRENISYPTDLSTKGYLLFCPTDGYHITKEQYKLFTKHLNALGMVDNTINVDIEFVNKSIGFNNEEVRSLSNFDYKEYAKTQLLFENCIADEKLRWTICVYQDFWGVIYGEKELIRRVSFDYDFECDLQKLKDDIFSEIVGKNIKNEYDNLMKLSYIRKNYKN